MSMTDPIADFLTRVRNAIHAAHETVEIPASKLKGELARILVEQGYIDSWAVVPAPDGGAGPADRDPAQVHRGPSLGDLGSAPRLAAGPAHVCRRQAHPKVLGGMGTAIVSTSHGVMTGHDARAAGVGGEVLAQVW